MECYLKGCTNQALKEERCFAYCSIDHKAKVVMVDYSEEKRRPGNLKEIQLGLKRMKMDYLHKKMMEEGR